MSHKGKSGNKPKPQKVSKQARHFEVCKGNTKRRLEKWKRNRKRWANDPEYQARQEARRKKLEQKKETKV